LHGSHSIQLHCAHRANPLNHNSNMYLHLHSLNQEANFIAVHTNTTLYSTALGPGTSAIPSITGYPLFWVTLSLVSEGSSFSGSSATVSRVATATSQANTLDMASLLWLWFVLGAGAFVVVALVDWY